MKDNVNADIEKRRKWRKVNRVLDRIAGFIIATVLVVGFGALGFEYFCVKGPSETFARKWVAKFTETRRFDFINNLFLTEDEIKEISYKEPDEGEEQEIASATEEFDASLITVSSKPLDETGKDAYGLVDDDGDGIIYEEFKYNGSQCYMIIVLDPTRVFVGMPEFFGGNGLMLEQMCEKYGAIGGINAGGFIDTNGSGSGGFPDGITIVNGVVYNESSIGGIAGLDEQGLLVVGYYNFKECVDRHLINVVSFNPVLIMNGYPVESYETDSGSNPRTVLGQRSDGAILMLCVDGRQFFSPGLNYEECTDIMLSYGAVNAINMDGGSSSCMMLNGEIKNNPTNLAGGSRYLPTAWLFK